ncbi:glycosyl transferase, family 8 [Streptococcus pneumoniae]|nr:glycosyl transferase, family 8 [Streptococcus pneumoniae]VJS79379.1 glycosyl transferase, family 8 [Streptococcus pneumoniae]VNU93695.1 glycosyl transferase, family 8 [Streptococcus pneumoniae]
MRKSIVLAADNAYLIPLETTIKSVLYHNRDVDFYILNSDIAPEWFKLLGRKMEVVNSTIRSVHIDKELFESYKTGPHINYASYFRFFATEVVESDRVLYLDSDIIVTGELATLFEIDLKGYSIGAVDDVYAYEGRKSGFNSGMLLMDVVNKRIEWLLDDATVYLDINHGAEVLDVLSKARDRGVKIFTFDNTRKSSEDSLYDGIFSVERPDDLVDRMKNIEIE